MGNSVEARLYNAEIMFANASSNLRCNLTVFLSIALS